MIRREALQRLGAFALLAQLGAPALAAAQGSPRFLTLESPVQTETQGKIEVLEFFHYGCPHCRDFEPLINAWAKKLPDDVVFTRIPTIWSAALAGLAALYYALAARKRLDLNESVFAAIQDRHQPLDKPEVVREWARENKLDVDAFMDAYNSFGVKAQVERAKQLARAYKIDGVPTMAVAGRFITSATLTGSHEATLSQVDSLIARVRKKRP
jgi:thiol:disulfide interchange protein DsbA